jgi:hypothetical protein
LPVAALHGAYLIGEAFASVKRASLIIPFGSSRRPPLQSAGAVHCSASWVTHWQPADERTLYVAELFFWNYPMELFFEPSLRSLDHLVRGNCSENDAFTPLFHGKF